jgi:hypothetical protein
VPSTARYPRAAVIAAITVIVACAALLGRVGADARWLAALGQVIASHHAIPAGVPFAAAPTGHWPNALVLAELIFTGLEHLAGDRGLMLAQLVAVAVALSVLARDARAGGASERGTVVALLVAGLAVLPSLAIARVQMFSLVLFPVLVALLRADRRDPSNRIWLAVPLLAVWSNLHGAALLGLGVTVAYLALSRGRSEPGLAVGVAIASIAALCLTPALLGTADYYRGLLTNVAAERGAGMWGPLSVSAPFDVVVVLCVAALATRLRRAMPPVWELAVLVVLAVATVRADRNGVWLLFFLVPPAAKAMAPARRWPGLAVAAALVSIAVVAVSVARGPVASGASPSMIARAITLAHGSPVLAGQGVDEQIALAGGRVWAGNPIDAFTHSVQATYLDWLSGAHAGDAALSKVGVVLVDRGSPAARLMGRASGFRSVGADATTRLYQRVSTG